MDFSANNALNKRAFNDQKALLKKILRGDVITCNSCKKALVIKVDEKQGVISVKCKQGCCDYLLDIA